MGEVLDVVKALVEPSLKLMELVGNAVGTVYEPRHTRKMADAEAYKIKVLSEAASDASSLPVTYDKGDISMSTADTDDIFRRAELRERKQKIREQKNIEGVIGYAQQELLGAPMVPNTPVDEDWIARLFNIIKEINSDEMQHIWGKILAGEVTTPGSFSRRTLDVVRNLSQADAQAFQEIAPYVFRGGRNLFIPASEKLLSKYGVPYSVIMTLDECGLLVSDFGLSLKIKVGDGGLYTRNYIMLFSTESGATEEISHRIYSLTKAGCELFKILSVEYNDDYFMDFAEELYEFNKVKIKVHKVNDINDTNINYEDDPVKVFGNEQTK